MTTKAPDLTRQKSGPRKPNLTINIFGHGSARTLQKQPLKTIQQQAKNSNQIKDINKLANALNQVESSVHNDSAGKELQKTADYLNVSALPDKPQAINPREANNSVIEHLRMANQKVGSINLNFMDGGKVTRTPSRNNPLNTSLFASGSHMPQAGNLVQAPPLQTRYSLRRSGMVNNLQPSDLSRRISDVSDDFSKISLINHNQPRQPNRNHSLHSISKGKGENQAHLKAGFNPQAHGFDPSAPWNLSQMQSSFTQKGLMAQPSLFNQESFRRGLIQQAQFHQQQPLESVNRQTSQQSNMTKSSRGRGRPPGSKNKKTLEQLSRGSSIAGRRGGKAAEKANAAMSKLPLNQQFSFQGQEGAAPASQRGGLSEQQRLAIQQMDQPQARMVLEQMYMESYRPGRRHRKNKDQMGILMEFFDKDPDWSFETKMHIAKLIGQTPGQVSKWNWDQRKKRKMPTERKRKP